MNRPDYQPLGKYIEQVNVRNRDLSITNLMGVSIEKKFIPSIANIIGTDLSPYKVVKPGQFAYGPVTSRNGEKITIALYDGEEDCIISQAYESFRIKDTNELLPEYLMMWAKRPEFDRYARFMSHGSVRELFSWEEMCNVLLPVPPIEEQRRIVSEYQTVERRIQNNELLIKKLEETAQAIYHHTFVEGIDEENLPEGWKKGCLGDVCEFSNGKLKEPTEGTIPIYGGNGVVGYCSEGNAQNVIVIGRVGVNCGCLYLEESSCWINDNAIKGISKNGYLLFSYYHMSTLDINKYSGGSSQPLVTQTILNQIPCIIPNLKSMKTFEEKVCIIRKQIKLLSNELIHLRSLQSLLTSKLS